MKFRIVTKIHSPVAEVWRSFSDPYFNFTLAPYISNIHVIEGCYGQEGSTIEYKELFGFKRLKMTELVLETKQNELFKNRIDEGYAEYFTTYFLRSIEGKTEVTIDYDFTFKSLWRYLPFKYLVFYPSAKLNGYLLKRSSENFEFKEFSVSKEYINPHPLLLNPVSIVKNPEQFTILLVMLTFIFTCFFVFLIFTSLN